MICKSLKFLQNYSFSFKKISLEKPYTFIFLFFTILQFLNFEGIEILSTNILIFLSAGYLVEGYQNLLAYFEKFEIGSSIKFLIIFLYNPIKKIISNRTYPKNIKSKNNIINFKKGFKLNFLRYK